MKLMERLAADGLTLAVAESCTGGLLGAALTADAGASRVFLGGILAYGDQVKREQLGVPEKRLKNGAVSAAAVEAMAEGVRERFGADVGVAISGIAGPGGGSVTKPVGTVWIAVLGPEHLLNVHKFRFKGDREAVRRQSVEAAVELIEAQLSEGEKEGVAVHGAQD